MNKRSPSPASFRRSRAAVWALWLWVSLAVVGAPLTAYLAQEDKPEEAASEASPTAGFVLKGTIDGDIDNVASAYVARLVREAKARNAAALLLELNTFGGRVDSAVAIRDALIELEIPTVVFINKRAISAGALISLACDKIVMSPGGTIGAATPITVTPGAELPEAVSEKYLSYFREEMRSTAEAKGRDADVAEAMVDADKVVEGVSEEGKLLTLTTKKALELNFADFEATSSDEALELLGLPKETEELVRTWSESLVGFLTSQAIVSLLGVAMMVLAYMEYQTPGFGIFGGSAVACFLILFFSHYLVNLAGWEELLLFVIGMILLMVEIFVLPGFGVAGILGVFFVMASGVLILMAGDWSDFSFSNPFSLDAIQRVLFSALLGFGVLLLLLRLLPKKGGSAAGRLILGTSLAGGDALLEATPQGQGEPWLGKKGVALSPLKPSGKAKVEGQRLEVATEGEYIEAGEKIQILRRQGSHWVVSRVQGEE
jgi:membrane-bound serine protease (ClpP class)